MIMLLWGIIGVVAILFIYYYFWFLRNPKRNMAKGKILCPADGKIVRIIPYNNKKVMQVKKGFLGKIKVWLSDAQKSGYMIIIVMNPFDMHFQKAPCDCTILKIKHVKGKMLNAVLGAGDSNSTFENEHNTILLKTKYGKMKIVQIAGFLARRIHCFVKNGQKIQKGEDLGVIKFGSQVCLIIPKVKLQVKEGQKVRALETVIA